MYTFEPRSAVKLLTISTFPASILTLAPLWNTQPSMVTLPGVFMAKVAPFSMLMFYSVAVIKSTIPDRNNGNFSSQKAAPIGVSQLWKVERETAVRTQ